MGLDTSHGCWHGAYSAFMRWRQAIAKAAGYPPLRLMEGFYTPEDFWFHQIGNGCRMELFPISVGGRRSGWSYAAEEALSELPIKWDGFRDDPLVKLLSHSDCDGEIEAEDCGPLAERLAELLPKLPTGDGGGHIGDWREKTQMFIDGLLAASAAGESVEFH